MLYGDLKIDKEFQAYFPPLKPQELSALTESLVKEKGALDAVDVWRDTIIDGHNRMKICEAKRLPMPQIRFHPELKTRDDVILWIVRKQLGRRNLTQEQFDLYVGTLYNKSKKAVGGDQKSKAQIDTSIDVSKKIAEETGVSKATVKRKGALVESKEKIIAPISKAIETGDVELTEAQTIRLGKLDSGDQKQIMRQVQTGATTFAEALGDGKPRVVKKKAEPKGHEKQKAYTAFGIVVRYLASVGLKDKHDKALNAILKELK